MTHGVNSELLGEGGIYVEPSSEAELTCALRHVFASEDLRQRMRQAGLAATRQLTWEAAAHQMRALIHQVGAQA